MAENGSVPPVSIVAVSRTNFHTRGSPPQFAMAALISATDNPNFCAAAAKAALCNSSLVGDAAGECAGGLTMFHATVSRRGLPYSRGKGYSQRFRDVGGDAFFFWAATE